jgi:hypothetical protein
MNDETESGQPEGEALPTSTPPPLPPQGGFFSPDDSPATRAEAAIERWYAGHYHRAAAEGRAPLSADDKAALIASVREAVAQPKE